jgi:hypothetical protein
MGKPGILGVMIGGSLARGQEWRHSDLELGLLLAARDPALPYFNVLAGRGMEVIQLVQPDLASQVAQVQAGDMAPLLGWPIQLWRGRIVHDPTGLLARFKRQFDALLFQDAVLECKVAGHRARLDQALHESQDLLAAGRPAAALVRLRYAMNEAILAFHWAHRELPRSQNRTASRLRRLCRKTQALPFYDLYRQVFALHDAAPAIRAAWPQVREQVLELTRLWGDSARDFFDYAVDSHFAWRQNAGILTVYRLYVPILGGAQAGLFPRLDDPAWRAHNPALLAFLGLSQVDAAQVDRLARRLAQAAEAIRLN